MVRLALPNHTEASLYNYSTVNHSLNSLYYAVSGHGLMFKEKKWRDPETSSLEPESQIDIKYVVHPLPKTLGKEAIV